MGRLTVTGTTMGTPCYMAPEQARPTAGSIGPAADIYALGSMLYELLAGRPPFEGTSAVDVVSQPVNEEPLSPATIRPRLPADLVTICLKCLEKAPARRYASALELAEDLRRFQADEPIRARPVGVVGRAWRWCRRRPLVAGLIALCGLLMVSLIATVFYFNFHLARTAEEERRQIVQLNISIGVFETERGDHFMAALRFTEALRLDQGYPEDEHRRRIAKALQHCPRLVQLRVADRRVLCVHLGADGGWLATVGSDHSIEVVDVMTGRAVGATIRLDHEPKSGMVSPDGRRLITFSAEKPALVWDLSTGKARNLDKSALRHAIFHPEGQILCTLGTDSMVRLWDLSATQLDLPPALSGAAVKHAALSDDGRWLFTVDADNVGQLRDLATGKVMAAPLRLKQEVQLAAISADGKRVALVGSDRVLRVWDVATAGWLGNPMPLPSEPKHVGFCPDGERILTVAGDQSAQVWHIATGAGLRMIHSHGHVAHAPRFDSTGRRVIAVNSAGVARAWNTQTGEALTPPLRHGGNLHAAGFFGTKLVAISDRGIVSVWELPEPGEGPPAPETRSVADLVAYTQLVAGARIDEQQRRQALDTDELRAAWENQR
jgi:WD40 repeat protein